MRPKAITDPADIHRLTSYFAWSSWAASTHRPGKDYSYTNSWPPEPLVGNGPSGQVVVWSMLSLIALLVGIGALFAVFGRWEDRLGWRGRHAETISFRPPGEVALAGQLAAHGGDEPVPAQPAQRGGIAVTTIHRHG